MRKTPRAPARAPATHHAHGPSPLAAQTRRSHFPSALSLSPLRFAAAVIADARLCERGEVGFDHSAGVFVLLVCQMRLSSCLVLLQWVRVVCVRCVQMKKIRRGSLYAHPTNTRSNFSQSYTLLVIQNLDCQNGSLAMPTLAHARATRRPVWSTLRSRSGGWQLSASIDGSVGPAVLSS